MANNCNPIKGINVAFRQHALAEYPQAHHKLNTQYFIVITNIEDLFDAEAIIQALVTAKLVESMDLPNDAEVAKVKQMLNSSAMTLVWHLYMDKKHLFDSATQTWLLLIQVKQTNFFILQLLYMGCTSKKTFNRAPLLKSAQNRLQEDQQHQPPLQTTKISKHQLL